MLVTLSCSRTFNISSGDRHKTIEVFNLIQNVIGKNIDHEVLNYDSQEIRRQFMDSTLLSQETKWQPQKTMEKSISEIVEWYIENL